MNITVTPTPIFTEIKLAGELDSETAPLLEEKVQPLIVDGCRLVLNMSEVSFMSSAGLRILFSLRRQLPPRAKLVLLGLSAHIRDTIIVTGFGEFFMIASNPTEAAAFLNRP
jgi:anti-sigma B factor antagonist